MNEKMKFYCDNHSKLKEVLKDCKINPDDCEINGFSNHKPFDHSGPTDTSTHVSAVNASKKVLQALRQSFDHVYKTEFKGWTAADYRE